MNGDTAILTGPIQRHEAGAYQNASAAGRGTYSYSWARSVFSTSKSLYSVWSRTRLDTTASGEKEMGLTVRCVAR